MKKLTHSDQLIGKVIDSVEMIKVTRPSVAGFARDTQPSRDLLVLYFSDFTYVVFAPVCTPDSQTILLQHEQTSA